MKKLFTTMLVVVASGAAFALPVGNPSEASLLCDGICWEGHCGDLCDPGLTWCDAFSFRLGFYGDYVFEKHLQVGQLGETTSDYEHFSLWTNAAYLAANLWDRVDIFATLGASSFAYNGAGSTFRFPPVSATQDTWIEVESNSTFSWSVGARATLWECGCTSVGLEGQVFQFKPQIRTVNAFNSTTGIGNGLIHPANIVNAKYTEGQIGLGVSHRIHCFVPYVAVKWGRAYLNQGSAIVGTTAIAIMDSESINGWGYAVGVSVVDCEKAAITGEFRGGDELAAYVNGQFRF